MPKGELPLRGGDEYDAMTGWRRVLRFRSGRRKAAKQNFNQRVRKYARLTAWHEALNYLVEETFYPHHSNRNRSGDAHKPHPLHILLLPTLS